MRCFGIVLLSGACCAQSLIAQVAAPPLYPEAYEIALARSAAPPPLSDNADVYVLRPSGFEKVHTGKNGAACIVARDHPDSLYPICYNPEAARTIMPVEMEQHRLRRAGLSEDSIKARIRRSFATGKFTPPRSLAIAYMMSKHQVIYAGATGRRVGQWFPHLMYYLPHATREQMAITALPNGDFQIGDEGEPTAHFVVMTREWATAPPLPALAPALTAHPGWLCAGDKFVLAYDGNMDEVVFKQREAGTAAVTILDRTPFLRDHALARPLTANRETVVEATRGSAVVAVDTVSVHPETMEHNLKRAPTCSGRASFASMAIPPNRASDRIRPRGVTNHGTEPVLVVHRGVQIRLAPKETTDAFNEVPFSGDWVVIVERGPTNQYCPVTPTPPEQPEPQIHVTINTGCAR